MRSMKLELLDCIFTYFDRYHRRFGEMYRFHVLGISRSSRKPDMTIHGMEGSVYTKPSPT
jgi:hypothetical protein